MPIYCFHETVPAAEVTATITLSGDSQANLDWTYDWAKPLPPKITVTDKGAMNFSRLDTSVYVTFKMNDATRRFYSSGKINVFGFADDDDYSQMEPIKHGHHQIEIMSFAPQQVSFCYKNHKHGGHQGEHKTSRYTIYLGLDGSPDYLPYWIDPIISNGGNVRENDSAQ